MTEAAPTGITRVSEAWPRGTGAVCVVHHRRVRRLFLHVRISAPLRGGRLSRHHALGHGVQDGFGDREHVRLWLSKFVGIKVIAEMPPGRRVLALLFFIGLAEAGCCCPRADAGTVELDLSFPQRLAAGHGVRPGARLSGRPSQTELLTASMCVSFIMADGATRRPVFS